MIRQRLFPAVGWTAFGRAAQLIITIVLPVTFILLPILSFILVSFWTEVNGETVHRLTLDNYVQFFTATGYFPVYARTVLLSAEITVINLIIAAAVAVFLSRRAPRPRFVLLMLFVLPLFMSYIIKVYSIRSLLGQRGLVNDGLMHLGLISTPIDALLFSRTAMLLTLAILYLPFAILPIYLALDRIPPSYAAANADLGGGEWHYLRHVVAPLSLPGVVLGGVFTFVLTFGDFVTPQMVGGTSGFTFGRIVFSQFGLALNWPLGSALAVILLTTAALVVALAGLLLRPERVR